MAPIKEWFGGYNVIFNWFELNYGYSALEEYWKYIAQNCFEEVIEKFKNGGLTAIKDYYEYTFGLDEGECKTSLENGKLTIEVVKCPDYEFMKSSSNPNFIPIKNYCKHHEIINGVLAKESGHLFCMEECDSNGRCKWAFKKGKGD
jgi:hypothetical protein